ncbi:hypothetical protein SOVF_081040 [Spinacia oleracea]|uniref:PLASMODESMATA CALLOSE-BINDING PROTEIN 4 n=1 Tax=Spinacia oleracea TaxID=3562 RepID=A0A9R0J003_SPIOL|nr:PLASMODESMATA CALLOSE-BINDING PROTEIN 4 [Spinacia oleracea]KNA17313.1 hypothetical protein SOVF_081040 [Spinacia oleracea]
MAKLDSIYIFLLLSSLIISKSGGIESETQRKLQKVVRRLDDNTITNPANFPPYTPTPTIITVPASNPTTPVNDPIPTTPPATTTVPSTTTPAPPITNPANPGNVPVSNPPTDGSGTAGGSWCIANSGASESALQSGLDYACGSGLADCSTIQDGGSCYNPNSLANHASYAFNSYFQKNPSSTSCDFGGAAVMVNTNPSTGSCIYPSSATGTGTGAGGGAAMPLSTTPPTTETPSSTFPTPTTSSPGTTGLPYGSPAYGNNYGSPPSLTTPSNPNSLFPASYGPDSPPLGNTLPAGTASLRPDISFIIPVVFYLTGKLILGT